MTEPSPERGPVLIQVEYRIDPARAPDYVRAMYVLRLERLRDGALRWDLFSDPADPSRYDVGPRAEDVDVVYTELVGEERVRRKASLADLLERIEGSGRSVLFAEARHADPRELALKAVAQLRPLVELLAKLVGELDDRPQVNLRIAPEWIAARAALLEALAPYPEARAAAAERLAALGGG